MSVKTVPTALSNPGQAMNRASVYTLPEAYRQAIISRMHKGESLPALIRVIQKEWGLLPDLSQSSMMQQLLRFRKRFAPLATTDKDSTTKEILRLRALTKKLEPKVHVVQELEKLAQMQLERVADIRKKEKELTLPMQQTEKMVEVAAELLKDLFKVQIDLGLVEYNGPLAKQVAPVRVTTPDGTVVETGMTPERELDSALMRGMKTLQRVGYVDGTVVERVRAKIEAAEVEDQRVPTILSPDPHVGPDDQPDAEYQDYEQGQD